VPDPVPAQAGGHASPASALGPPGIAHAFPGAAKADPTLGASARASGTPPVAFRTHAVAQDARDSAPSARGHALAGSFLASASAAAFVFSASRSAIFFFSRSASSANSSLAALSFDSTPCARAVCGQLRRADVR